MIKIIISILIFMLRINNLNFNTKNTLRKNKRICFYLI